MYVYMYVGRYVCIDTYIHTYVCQASLASYFLRASARARAGASPKPRPVTSNDVSPILPASPEAKTPTSSVARGDGLLVLLVVVELLLLLLRERCCR